MPHSIRVVDARSHLIPVSMRVPLKFGNESIDRVTCLRVEVTIEDEYGHTATGWGETPLSVTWAWPSQTLSYAHRYDAMIAAAKKISAALVASSQSGHAIDIGHDLTERIVPDAEVPQLAALIIASAYDIAVHDAYAKLHDTDVYQIYGAEFCQRDLASYFGDDHAHDWKGKYVADFLVEQPPVQLPVWHLVGGLDPIEADDLDGSEPDDGYPITLRQWIQRDGLTHLKIKLRGSDDGWDFDRIVRVAALANEYVGISNTWLSTDFNCTVTDPDYVNQILDRLQTEHPPVFARILYVEQPFPHDLNANRIDVHSVSRRRGLFLDESAHDWRFVRLGKSLGWTGVALKTCKTQTGALLSMCWAKANAMPLMVQDLTNPMLAAIPHVRLAAHVGTIAGVESNGMQFYPDASLPEAEIHPGIYRRRGGILNLSTIGGPGFGYRLDEIDRTLPPPAF